VGNTAEEGRGQGLLLRDTKSVIAAKRRNSASRLIYRAGCGRSMDRRRTSGHFW
jgi:hypothetical protein